MTNRLYYGDNLDILRSREYFPDECIDLIYLDPALQQQPQLQRTLPVGKRRRQRGADHRLRGHLALGRNRRGRLTAT